MRFWFKRVVLMAVAACAMVVSASAQFSPVETPLTDPNAFKIITPADLDEAFRRIRANLRDLGHANAKERGPILDSILRLCQAELNKTDNAVGVIKDDENLWLGAYSAVERLILSLGDDSLPAYEKAYGPRAAMLLEQARREGNREDMLEVNRRFGLTRAGVNAAVLMASMWWEEGEASLAARSLERALSVPKANTDASRANLAAWLGACYQQLGERAHLTQLLEAVKSIAALEVDTGGGKRKLEELLRAQLADTRDSTNDSIDNLGVSWVGGNYANTGIPPRPGDFDTVAWSRTLPRLESPEANGNFMRYPLPIVPPMLPASDGMLVYINIGDALVAYDVFTGGKTTGEPVWRVKPFARDAEKHFRLTDATDPGLILPVSVHKGVVFAALENPLNRMYHSYYPDTTFRLYSHYPQVRRALCAVDGETGRLLWRIGGLYEGDEHETTNFLSAVVHQGTLYAIGSRVPGQAEIFLYALNPESGDVLWHLRLCYGQQETTMFGRPSRQPYPSLAAIAGGELYVCTNIGGVVAVNLARRCLSWIARYDYMPRPVTKYIDTYYRPVSWYNSPTLYAEAGGRGYVVSAPTDSQKLVAYDAGTGDLAWQLARDWGNDEDAIGNPPLSGALSLIGIRNGIVYVAGRYRLHMVELATGRLVDQRNTPPVSGAGRGSELVGRPCMAGSSLLWPSTGGLAEIDIDNRKIVAQHAAPSLQRVPGLSVFVQNGLTFTVAGNDYTRGNCQLAARFDSQRLMAEARIKVSASPTDPEAALRYGQLNLRLGERAEGLKYLELAHKVAGQPPINSRVRNAAGRTLVAVQLESADLAARQGKFLEALVGIEGARAYASTPSDLSECFVRNENCLRAMNENDALRELYQDVYEKDPPFGVGSDPQIPVRTYGALMLARSHAKAGLYAEAVGLFGELLLSPDSYAYAGERLRLTALNELQRVVAAAGAGIYSEHERAADDLLKKGDTESLRKIMRAYPLATAADEAALRLALELDVAGESKAGAMLLVASLEERPVRPRRAELLAQAALLHARAGEPARARLVAQRALREFPDAQVTVNGVKQSLRNLLAPLLRDESIETAPARLPEKIEELWSRDLPQGTSITLPSQPAPGERMELFIGVNEASRGSFVDCLDPRNGESRWSGPGVIPQSCRRVRGGVLVELALGLTLFAPDGSPTWSQPTDGTPYTVDVANGLVTYSCKIMDPGTGKKFVQVTMRDLANGLLVWQTRIEGVHPYWLKQVDDGVAMLVSRDRGCDLLLLNPETGEIARKQALGNDIRANTGMQPFLRGGLIHVIDNAGRVQRFGANLEQQSTLACGESNPTLMAPLGQSDILVAGQRSITLFGVDENRAKWNFPLRASEIIIERAVVADTLMLAVRRGDGTNRVVGVRLSNGAEAFSYDIARAGANEFISCKTAVPCAGGMVFLYLVQEPQERGRGVKVTGQRMLLLDTSGKVQFDWNHAAKSQMQWMQMAVTEGFIAVSCDSALFCFGDKAAAKDG